MTEPTPTGRAEARPYAANVGSHFSATGVDAAIDRVATRLVALPEDAALLPRLLARLPERASSLWWVAMPVQLAAGAALVLMAFVWARPSREVTPRESLPVTERTSAAEAPLLEAKRQPVAAPIPDPRSLLRQGFGGQASIPNLALDRPDHERSLAPVGAIDALELVEIAPPAMELDATAALEPLVLPELALVPQGDS